VLFADVSTASRIKPLAAIFKDGLPIGNYAYDNPGYYLAHPELGDMPISQETNAWAASLDASAADVARQNFEQVRGGFNF